MTAVEPVEKRTSRLLLSVTEAAEMLGIGRTLAYQMAHRYELSGGVDGMPVIRLGSSCLRVPRWALLELARTGRVVMLPTAETGTDDR